MGLPTPTLCSLLPSLGSIQCPRQAPLSGLTMVMPIPVLRDEDRGSDLGSMMGDGIPIGEEDLEPGQCPLLSQKLKWLLTVWSKTVQQNFL